MWIKGTSDNYIDLCTQLSDILESNHVSAVAINAGGTGYAVDDVLTVSGGTSSYPAKLEVLTVSSGVITAVRIMEAGAYSVNPGNPVSVTGGSGSGATFNLTFDTSGWTVQRESQEGATVAVNAGGTGYSVNDTLTVLGGEGDVLTAMTLNVDTVSGSTITGVSFVSRGSYEITPGTTGIGVSGGGGTSATFDFTYRDSGEGGDKLDKVLILEGEGAGSDEILVGIRTYSVAAFSGGGKTCYNWSLNAMTGYNSGLTYENQPNLGPTEGITPSSSGGSYVPLKSTDAFDMTFWFNITPYRIIGIIKCEDAVITHYSSMYLGFMNRPGTVDEYPYPMLVASTTSRYDTLFEDTSIRYSGLVDAGGVGGKPGPHFFRRFDQIWQEIRNTSNTDSGSESRAQSQSVVVYPSGVPDDNPAGLDIIDQLVGSGDLIWSDICPTTGVPGIPNYTMKRIPGGNNFLVPAMVLSSQNIGGDARGIQIEGELDDVFWTSAGDGESSEDRISVGNDRYTMFQNGSRAAVYTFMAIKEGDG